MPCISRQEIALKVIIFNNCTIKLYNKMPVADSPIIKTQWVGDKNKHVKNFQIIKNCTSFKSWLGFEQDLEEATQHPEHRKTGITEAKKLKTKSQ